MKREIKFRGLKDGLWIYGYLTKDAFGNYFIDAMIDNTCDRVDGESWGQYTGLKDKNGVEIYEGDIIKVLGVGRHEFVNVVEFKDACFMRIHKDYPIDPSYLHDAFGWEVIGNIHQNPELL